MARYDILDIRKLVEAALDGFCEQHEITGRQERQRVLAEIAAQARELRGEQ
jgi:hypothetical protein